MQKRSHKLQSLEDKLSQSKRNQNKFSARNDQVRMYTEGGGVGLGEQSIARMRRYTRQQRIAVKWVLL